MIGWLVVIGAGLALGVLLEVAQRRVADKVERQRARESHHRLLAEIRRHP